MIHSQFTETFLNNIPGEGTIFDLGAGDLRWTKIIAEKHSGQKIIAVDKKIPGDVPSDISFIEDDIREAQLEKAGAFFLRNVIQFIPKSEAVELLEKISSLTENGGIVGVETFFRDPVPSFGKPTTCYEIDDFRSFFDPENPEAPFRLIYSNKESKLTKGLDGTEREFFTIQIVLKKK